jgi:hypothetical protein
VQFLWLRIVVLRNIEFEGYQCQNVIFRGLREELRILRNAVGKMVIDTERMRLSLAMAKQGTQSFATE